MAPRVLLLVLGLLVGTLAWAGDSTRWTIELTTGYDWNGNAVTNWKDEFNFASIRLTPSARYWFAKSREVNLYGALGPLLVIPSPVNEESSVDDLWSSSRYLYGLGWGVQTEIGGEWRLGETWGLNFAVAFESIWLPRASNEYVSTSGKKTVVHYADNPQVDSHNQTADDAAQSTPDTSYYTYPTVHDDFSDMSFKVGVVWHL